MERIFAHNFLIDLSEFLKQLSYIYIYICVCSEFLKQLFFIYIHTCVCECVRACACVTNLLFIL